MVVFSVGPNVIEFIADRVPATVPLAVLPLAPLVLPPLPRYEQPAAIMATAAAAHPVRNRLAFTAKSPYLASYAKEG
jgi:hypothetical protein